MKSRQAVRAIAGVLLCAAGLWLALPAPYKERTYIFNADGCRMETTIVEKPGTEAQGSVVLFHGISANKKIMAYLARGFAEQGLRVYVPDLAGHGRTPGPFSPARAEQCGEALLRELLTRGVIDAKSTILAGHSMGGAIAERVAARVAVAGLVTVSPAPMRAAHGVTPEKLLFTDPPELPPNSLVIVGTRELESMRGNAADMVGLRHDATSKFLEIAAGSILIVLLLRFWIPLRRIGLFQGDYLASFLLLLGAVLTLMHWSAERQALASSTRDLLAAAFAGLVLLLLATPWFDLTFYEAWLTAAKWARFPFLVVVVLPYHFAEEVLLGPVQIGKRGRRLALALTLRLISWGALMGGVLILQNGV